MVSLKAFNGFYAKIIYKMQTPQNINRLKYSGKLNINFKKMSTQYKRQNGWVGGSWREDDLKKTIYDVKN